MAANWPITTADLRKELQIAAGSDDEAELQIYVTVACERIDANTGRNIEPSRHEIAGNLPETFILAARATAALWWRQSKNGPRNRPGGQAGEMNGPPAGIDLPSKVKGWLTPYPPRLYPPASPVFNPVTLSFADGTKVALSREGDIVTMSAIPGTNPGSIALAQPLPVAFQPAGNVASYVASSTNVAEPGGWYVVISELPQALGVLGVQPGAIGSAPWTPFSAQWLADPA